VPTVCGYCHNNRDYVDLNGQFVTLDPFEYRFMPSGPYSLDSQQERLRQLNEMIAFAQRHSGAAWELMDSIYPGTPSAPLGVHTPLP
jgi:hypothetical protein